LPLGRMPSGTYSRTAPAARGFYAKGAKPIVSQSNGGVTVTGVDFISSVVGFSQGTTPVLAGLANLHPAYFANDALGNFSRSYRQFMVNRARVCFATTAPTSVSGYVLLTSNMDGLSPCLPSDDPTFLNRAISMEGTVMGPVWEDLCCDIPLPGKWQDIDAFESADWRDHVPSEFFCYTTGTTGNLGNLILEYSVSFRDLLFTAHNSLLPYPNYSIYKPVDTGSTASGSLLALTLSGLTNPGSGTVWKMILDTDQSTLVAPTTLATAWKIGNQSTSDTAITLTSGQVFWGVVANTTIYVYPDIESAIVQSPTKAIYVATTQTSVSTYAFQCLQVHYSAYATVSTGKS